MRGKSGGLKDPLTSARSASTISFLENAGPLDNLIIYALKWQVLSHTLFCESCLEIVHVAVVLAILALSVDCLQCMYTHTRSKPLFRILLVDLVSPVALKLMPCNRPNLLQSPGTPKPQKCIIEATKMPF